MYTPNDPALDRTIVNHMFKLASTLTLASYTNSIFKTAEQAANRMDANISLLTMMFYQTLASIHVDRNHNTLNSKVLNYLKISGSSKASDIVANCGFSKIHTQNTLKELFEQGFIAREQSQEAGRPYLYKLTSVGDITISDGVANASPQARQEYNDTFKEYCNILVKSPSNKGLKADDLYLASVGGNKEPLDEAVARFQMDVQEQLDKAIERIRNTGVTDL